MNTIRPLSEKSRVSSGDLRIKQVGNGEYDVAMFTREGKYGVGFYRYTANDLLNLAMSLKDFVYRTQREEEAQ